ncbi:MAG TPA: hypothetical protein VMT27_02025 [Actinomycetes bacterium]|nr:hypothetical protein [Actinomycetes bacterium]
MTREKVEQERAVALNAAHRIADDLRVQAHDEASASIAEAVRPARARPPAPKGERLPTSTPRPVRKPLPGREQR